VEATSRRSARVGATPRPGTEHRCAPTIAHHAPLAVFQLAARCSPSFTIRRVFHLPFAIRRIFPLAARFSPRAVGVHKRRLADASADCRGTARRAPTLCLPTGRCARAAWLFAAGDGPPARFRRHNTTGAGLGPAPYLDQHHSPFAIRNSLFAIRRLFLFAIRDSRFAIRCLSPSTARRSLLAARRLSPLEQSVRAIAGIPDTFPSIAGTSCGRRIETRERLRALDKHAVLPVQSASII
jgi:hypothetical protein